MSAMPRATSFTFGQCEVDARRSRITCSYRVGFEDGTEQTFSDQLSFPDVPSEAWETVPEAVLQPTLQALFIILGINYWCAFPARNIRIEGFSLTHEQARFWDTLYLNGLAEFFYDMQMDFKDLIAFPFDASLEAPSAARFPRPSRSLLLNGAGKDSVLSAEILKGSGIPFDLFAFAPTPAHARIAKLIGARTLRVTRKRDRRLTATMARYRVSSAYPSVSTFTFIAVLLAELLGYDRIVFSNERSADIGNLVYKGLPVNHQWCKSTEAEKLINDYVQRYITPDIASTSLLREFSELEIVRRIVQYPQYLRSITSCNTYFWLPRVVQYLSRSPYWCKECPKCVFIFACYSAFLPRREVVDIFGADLYARPRLLPLFKSILGIEGFKPLDCVGEPEEMILAMHLASMRGEYAGEPAIQMFENRFPATHDFEALNAKVFA